MTGNQQDAEETLPDSRSEKPLNVDQSALKEKDGDSSDREDNRNDHSMEVAEEGNYDASKDSLGKSSGTTILFIGGHLNTSKHLRTILPKPETKTKKGNQSTSVEEKKYKCDVCVERFSDKNHLSTHEKTHTMIKPFKCDVCGVVLASAKSLRVHLMGHTGNYPMRCETCGKGFDKESTLKRHELTHTGNYEFECEICKKKFSVKRSLESHMVVHKPDRKYPNYSCHLCSYQTRRQSSVRSHLIMWHVPTTSHEHGMQ